VLALAPASHAGTSGIFGGGPFYINATNHITEIKNSGFTEAIIWNIEVKTNGDLNFNGEFPLVSNGVYIGDQTHPDFASNMAALKTGTSASRSASAAPTSATFRISRRWSTRREPGPPASCTATSSRSRPRSRRSTPSTSMTRTASTRPRRCSSP